MLTSYTASGLIQILLVFAIVVVIRLMRGRRIVQLAEDARLSVRDAYAAEDSVGRQYPNSDELN